MAKIRNEELDQLTGEVLPERTVLGAMPAGGGKGHGLNLLLCNHVDQSQHVSGNIIGIAVNLPQCGLTNNSKGAGLLGL